MKKFWALMLCLSISGVSWATPIYGQGTWGTTLQERDINGDGVTDAFYDTDLNITWLRESGASSLMLWDAANAWVNNLNVGGVTGWRLPVMTDPSLGQLPVRSAGGTNTGWNVDPSSSEFAHLYFLTLGNLSMYSAAGIYDTGRILQPGGGLWVFRSIVTGHSGLS